LTGDLPQFLPTLAIGTPAIRIFFDILIGQHRLKSAPSLIEVEHILHQEPLGAKLRDEHFIDPLPDALAHRDRLPGRRSRMPRHHHAHGRQLLIQFQPASIKHFDDLTARHPGHARRRAMSQHALDLLMLQEQIASPARHKRSASHL
jgi:hypothetical protein